jgi:hypothetical protein
MGLSTAWMGARFVAKRLWACDEESGSFLVRFETTSLD